MPGNCSRYCHRIIVSELKYKLVEMPYFTCLNLPNVESPGTSVSSLSVRTDSQRIAFFENPDRIWSPDSGQLKNRDRQYLGRQTLIRIFRKTRTKRDKDRKQTVLYADVCPNLYQKNQRSTDLSGLNRTWSYYDIFISSILIAWLIFQIWCLW